MELDKTACMCSKTSRVDNTKSVHNRPKPAVFVRTAQGLSSNQNEVAINSKSDLWRTALLHSNSGIGSERFCEELELKKGIGISRIKMNRSFDFIDN